MIYSQAKYVEKSILTNNRNGKYFDNIRTYTNYTEGYSEPNEA